MGYLKEITDKLDDEQDVMFVGTGIILVNERKQIFMAMRADNRQWSLPGGSLELGESLQKCIVRETLEETGIIIKEESLILNWVEALQEPIIKNGRKIYVTSVTFICDNYDDIDMQLESRELVKYGWLSLDEIYAIEDILTPYTKVAINKYKERFGDCLS